MVGHLGIDVSDLPAAKRYCDALMPLVGFEPFFAAEDEFSYKPAESKPALSTVIHPPRHFPQYPGHYYATFWLDPFGIKLEAVCHHDRD